MHSIYESFYKVLFLFVVHRPVITTDEKGGIRFQSGGDLVFQTGEGGQFQFMTADGSTMTTGLGEKARNHCISCVDNAHTEQLRLQVSSSTTSSCCYTVCMH